MVPSGGGSVRTLFALGRFELERLAEVAVEQVHIGRERERRRVVAEPPLHLHGVAALGEQPGRDRVAERVEPGPLDAGLRARRLQHPLGEVVRVEQTVPTSTGNTSSSSADAERPQPVGELERDRNVAPRVA